MPEMTDAPVAFDSEKFRQLTRAQWEAAAEAWDRWAPLLARWLGPATEAMLDMAAVGPGARVLDVAAGAGEQTLAAARRVGAKGYVLATDISPAILRFALRAARQAGLTQVETLELDGERHDTLPEASFDAAISRVGLIYFPDQQRALAGIRRALKRGGRFAAVVYSTPEKNPFFSQPVGIIRRRAQLPPPLPGQPGPFSLGHALPVPADLPPSREPPRLSPSYRLLSASAAGRTPRRRAARRGLRTAPRSRRSTIRCSRRSSSMRAIARKPSRA